MKKALLFFALFIILLNCNNDNIENRIEDAVKITVNGPYSLEHIASKYDMKTSDSLDQTDSSHVATIINKSSDILYLFTNKI